MLNRDTTVFATSMVSPLTGVTDQCIMSSCQAPKECLRSKNVHVVDTLYFAHASFPQEPPDRSDVLRGLYPHHRDSAIYMDEKLHKYFAHGEEYPLSVSGWWKHFFAEFKSRGEE